MSTMFTEKLRIKDLEDTLANSTPLLAVVGAGDFALEKIRAARVELVNRSASFDPKALRDQAQATFAEGVGAVQAEVQTSSEQIRALPDKAQDWPAKAQSLLAEVVATAFSTYGELAGRGKSVVDQVRGELPRVEVVKPVSRPTTSASSTAKKPAVKKTTVKKTTTTRTSTAKKATGGAATVKKTTTTSTRVPTSGAASPAKKTTSTSKSTSTSTSKPASSSS